MVSDILPANVAGLSSWCEISRDALTHNIHLFLERVGVSQLGVVVKSNAYGHGLIECARIFIDAGVGCLVVNSLDEALALRKAGIDSAIYCCGFIGSDKRSVAACVAANIEVVCYDGVLAQALNTEAKKQQKVVELSLKIETGNHRQGLELMDALALANYIDKSLPHLRIKAITTHFSDIEDTTDHRFAFGQLARFDEAYQAFVAAGFHAIERHSANSAATILYPQSHFDRVRVGLSAYGYWPSVQTQVSAQLLLRDTLFQLRPALTWKARIAQVKAIEAGAFVGYGRTYRAMQPSDIAIVPIGYHEGYARGLSNLGHALYCGQRIPIRGRVCMNMTMFDVTDVKNIGREDVVTLLGKSGDETVTAEDLAGWQQSINYEVVSRIHPEITRVIV